MARRPLVPIPLLLLAIGLMLPARPVASQVSEPRRAPALPRPVDPGAKPPTETERPADSRPAADAAAPADGAVAPAGAEPPAPAPSSSRGGAPETAGAPGENPFAETIDKVVDRSVEEQQEPCARAEREGVPCYPSDTEKEADEVSVAKSLKEWKEEASTYNGGGATATSPAGAPLGAFDPVQAIQGLARIFSGKNNTFYLYRVWDRKGERAVLRETETPPAVDPTDTSAGYVFVRKIRGQPAAVKAYESLNREVRDRNRARGALEPSSPK